MPKDPPSRFLELFQAIIVVAHGGFPRSMAKDTLCLHSTIIDKVFL